MKLPIANFFWNAYLKKRLEFFSDQEIGDLPALDWRVFCFPTVAILLDFLACKECKLIIVLLLIFQENLCSLWPTGSLCYGSFTIKNEHDYMTQIFVIFRESSIERFMVSAFAPTCDD